MSHRGASDFPDDINSYLEKERKNSSITGPFKSKPLVSNLIIYSINSAPKKNTSERRVILNLSFRQKKKLIQQDIKQE